jgi:hypothetical protein
MRKPAQRAIRGRRDTIKLAGGFRGEKIVLLQKRPGYCGRHRNIPAKEENPVAGGVNASGNKIFVAMLVE